MEYIYVLNGNSGVVAYFKRKSDLQKILNNLPDNYYGEIYKVHTVEHFNSKNKAQQILNDELKHNINFKNDKSYIRKEE